MSLSDEQWDFLRDVSSLIQRADLFGLKVTGEWLFRTRAVQKLLVKKGLSKTLNSQHLSKRAIDLNIFTLTRPSPQPTELNLSLDIVQWELASWSKVQLLGDFWEALSPLNEWGGYWKELYGEDGDMGHFERRASNRKERL